MGGVWTFHLAGFLARPQKNRSGVAGNADNAGAAGDAGDADDAGASFMRVAARARLVEVHGSGDVPTYWKVPFEWGRHQALADEDEPDGVAWLDAEDDERLLGVVAAVLAASPDATDGAAVASAGPVSAARRLLTAPPRWNVSHEAGWWTLLTFRGEAVAFVLPVTYDQGERNGLDEATIFHMGVLPEYRGRGFGRALLRRATRVAHGVWRIYCDTAADNLPMIRLFASEGWQRLPPHERPVVTSL